MKFIFHIAFIFLIPILVMSCNGNNKQTKTDSVLNQENNSSQNSLDWAAIYYGTLPCADCEGIRTQIKITQDGNFIKNTQYKGKDAKIFTEKGTFSWDETGNQIIFNNGDDTEKYLVSEDQLTLLDREGNKIEGGLADLYHLEKQFASFEGEKWRLTKLMGHDIEIDESGRYPYIQFELEENRFSGTTGCNRFFGEYILDKAMQLELSKIGVTKMACPDMTIEKQFLDVLNKVDNFSMSDDKMTLNKARMAPLAEFEPMYFDTE